MSQPPRIFGTRWPAAAYCIVLALTWAADASDPDPDPRLSNKFILFYGLNVVSSMVLRHGSLVCESCCAMHLHNPSRAVFADSKKAETKASAVHLVAPTGFEPATFALRGRRPKPLDDGAINESTENGWGGRSRTLTYGTRNRCPAIRRHPNLLPVRLLLFCKAQAQESILRAFPYAVKPLFQLFLKILKGNGDTLLLSGVLPHMIKRPAPLSQIEARRECAREVFLGSRNRVGNG